MYRTSKNNMSILLYLTLLYVNLVINKYNTQSSYSKE
jgi:hypothetical protein